MSHPNPITFDERQRIFDLHNDGACIETTRALTGRAEASIDTILKTATGRKARRVIQPKKDRWDWAFARAGGPKYEDRKGLR